MRGAKIYKFCFSPVR